MLPEDEDDKIFKVEIYNHHSFFYLCRLKFFNNREELMLKVGHFKFDQKVEVSLKFNERILGCRFRYHYKELQTLCDFEFLNYTTAILSI